MAIRTFVVIGTRPEAIKMAPRVRLLDNHSGFLNQLCLTGLLTPSDFVVS